MSERSALRIVSLNDFVSQFVHIHCTFLTTAVKFSSMNVYDHDKYFSIRIDLFSRDKET